MKATDQSKLINIKRLCSIFNLSLHSVYMELLWASNDKAIKIITELDGEIFTSLDYYDKIVSKWNYWNSKIVSYSESKNNSATFIPFAISNYLYYLFKDDELIYIGQTVSLGSRVREHQKTKEIDSVYWKEVDADEVIMVERMCINYHSPTLNIEEDDSATLMRRILETVIF